MKEKTVKMWIAREKNGSLWIFDSKPDYKLGMWSTKKSVLYTQFPINFKLFPSVTLENSPVQVEIKIVE